MTDRQAEWLYELADRDGETSDLRIEFPDTDWDAVEERIGERRRLARERWQAAHANDPTPRITLDDVNQVHQEIIGDSVARAFANGPLLDHLRKGRR